MSLFGYVNMVTTIHTYDELYLLDVGIRGDRSCYIPYDGEIEYHRREVINKMACYFPYEQGDLVSLLYDATVTDSVPVAGNLYFAKECKTNRDVYRNSGYSIVRDADKANIVVVPDVLSDYYTKMTCNIVAKDESCNHLYLVTIKKNGYSKGQFDAADLDAVRSYLRDVKGFVVDNAQCFNLAVWFIPKCDIICDVLNSTHKERVYCQENKIPIKAPTNICPETLIFWENMTDINLLTRTICTSDWRNYPLTTMVFLSIKQGMPDSNFTRYITGDFRNLINNVGWTYWADLKYNLEGRSVSPKDYKMLQSYLFAKIGVDENGGFVGQKDLNRIPKELQELLLFKVALKPQDIPNKLNLNVIRNIVG